MRPIANVGLTAECYLGTILPENQIAFHRRTDIGCWSHGWQILPMLAQHWLLVASSADFANVGTTVACRQQLRLHIAILGQCWANGGFLFKMAASNNGGFCET